MFSVLLELVITMKLFSLLLLSIYLAIQVESNEIDDLKKKVALECAKDYPVDLDDIKKMFNHVEVPDKPHVKCFLSCVLKKLNVLRDGKMDWKMCRELTKMGLSDENKAKVDWLTELCEKEVAQVDDECELAYNAALCKIKHANEMEIPHGEWQD